MGTIKLNGYKGALGQSPAYNRHKESNMKFSFRQWLARFLLKDQIEPVPVYDENSKFHSDGIRLQIYKASGGYVVETRSFDRKTDNTRNSMHIITDDEDLGERLGKILMLEALQR